MFTKKRVVLLFLMQFGMVNSQVPIMVKDIEVGLDSTMPQYLTVFDGHLYFGTVFVDGLWKTDGTEVGTVVAEGLASIGNDLATQLGVFNGQLYFNTFSNRAWWATPGGTDNAITIKNQINTLGEISYTSTVLGEEVLVFAATDYASAGNPAKLYRSDMTTMGTVEIGTFNSNSSGPMPRLIGTVNSQLLFSAVEIDQGRELYTTDATTATTTLMLELHTGSIGGISDVSGTNQSLITNEYYFPAFGDAGRRLWKTDGTAMGTVELDDLSSEYNNPQYLNQLNGSLLFFADSVTPPKQLFKINSGDAHPTQITFREPFSEAGCTDYNSMEYNGLLYFPFADNSDGCELWKTDGTIAGTSMVKDINPGSEHGFPKPQVVVDGFLYFTALKSGFGFELWKTDGTESGTTMVADLNPNNGSGITGVPMVVFNGELYFVGNDGVHGDELYKLQREEIIFTDGFELTGPI